MATGRGSELALQVLGITIFGKPDSESGPWEGTAGAARPQAEQKAPASPTGPFGGRLLTLPSARLPAWQTVWGPGSVGTGFLFYQMEDFLKNCLIGRLVFEDSDAAGME